MKTLQEWYDDYAISHQNKTNQKIHYFCVPAIFFSIVGMLMSIPSTFLQNTLGLNNPFVGNWASVLLLITLIFYLRLSFRGAKIEQTDVKTLLTLPEPQYILHG